MSRQEEMLRKRSTAPSWGQVILGLLTGASMALAGACCLSVILVDVLPGFVTLTISLILIAIGEPLFYVRLKRRVRVDSSLRDRLFCHGHALALSAFTVTFIVLIVAGVITIVRFAFA